LKTHIKALCIIGVLGATGALTYVGLHSLRASNIKSTLTYRECLRSFADKRITIEACRKSPLAYLCVEHEPLPLVIGTNGYWYWDTEEALQKELDAADHLGDTAKAKELQQTLNNGRAAKDNPDAFCREVAENKCATFLVSDKHYTWFSSNDTNQCNIHEIDENRKACKETCNSLNEEETKRINHDLESLEYDGVSGLADLQIISACMKTWTLGENDWHDTWSNLSWKEKRDGEENCKMSIRKSVIADRRVELLGELNKAKSDLNVCFQKCEPK
jgi:hypothetical protein